MGTVYLDSTVFSHLISAKSGVTHIKQFPKLELCEMILHAKLAKKNFNNFENNWKLNSVNLWSDSQIVLHWCRNHPSEWNVSDANRVSQIQTLISTYSWHYVKSAENPADLLSRGRFTKEILNSDFWFHRGKSNQNDSTTNLPELCKFTLYTVSRNPVREYRYNIFQRFSNFTRL